MHYSEWRPESQITAIAWSWVGEDTVHCVTLRQDLKNERAMHAQFLAAYALADVVTGHNIRRHDLPLLNDHAIRFGWKLPRILTQDTMEIGAVKGLGKSQDNLAVTLGLTAEKHHMAGADWREANALTPEGNAKTRKRVIDDVLQHKALREELIRRGALRPPRLWRP
jgi:DNA polymerase elongation subunit (family B)